MQQGRITEQGTYAALHDSQWRGDSAADEPAARRHGITASRPGSHLRTRRGARQPADGVRFASTAPRTSGAAGMPQRSAAAFARPG